MKIKDLDGNQHIWSLKGYGIGAGICSLVPEHKSSLHLAARKLLQELYPTLIILEEVPIRIHRNENLYLDFYLPLRKMAIEVNGEQHFKYIPHFHHTLNAYMKSRKRDEDKKTWCDINNITLIEFPYNESVDEWKNKLQ